MNLVMLQFEDEFNGILFDIIDLHISHGEWMITEK